MSDCVVTLQNLFQAYKRWVGENPQIVSDVETTVRWISYFVAGRMTNSAVVSELVYSLSNILVLLNDRITEKAHNIASRDKGFRIKLMLTALEYSEVFIEISARKTWGERGRWFFIVLVQTFKCIARYFLTTHYSEEIIRSPAIPILNRKKLIAEASTSGQFPDQITSENSFSFKLKRSGRVVRKVEGAPPMHMRNWIPLGNEINTTKLNQNAFKLAETMYILKPLLHLGSIRLFGYKTWKSFLIAFLLDFTSLRMYYKNQNTLMKQQRTEVSKRCVHMLLYLMRSPLYEKYTEKRIKRGLSAIGNNIPLTNFICEPLSQYIPHWQDTYFYLWST